MNELRQWSKLKWISFLPKTSGEYDDKEFYEVMFIKGLVRSGLPKETIALMLSQLESPYCYSYNKIFWDFHKNEWLELDELVANYIEENMDEICAEHIGTYLENLADSEDYAGLKSIVVHAKTLAAKRNAVK
jgi:succinate dehydrogenase flavin-adding protein (antitoxin of CptAB toxin-antitoxin module)